MAVLGTRFTSCVYDIAVRIRALVGVNGFSDSSIPSLTVKLLCRAKVHSTRLTEAANGLRTFDVNKGRAAIASGDMWDAIHVVDADKGTVMYDSLLRFF